MGFWPVCERWSASNVSCLLVFWVPLFSYLFERFCLAGRLYWFPLKVNSIFMSITLSLKRFILLSCFNTSCSIVLILCSSNNVFIFSYCSLWCVPFRLPSCELILFFCFWIFSEVSKSTMSCSSLIVYDLFVASSFLSKIVSESILQIWLSLDFMSLSLRVNFAFKWVISSSSIVFVSGPFILLVFADSWGRLMSFSFLTHHQH